MQQPTPLKQWMDSRGYSNSELALLMGFSYEYIFKLASGKLPELSEAFRWRFVQKFGWEEANKVFDAGPRPEIMVEKA